MLLQVDFCATEWATGTFVASQFFEKDVLKSYTTHLQDIRRWCGLKQEVIARIRGVWFKRASYVICIPSAIDLILFDDQAFPKSRAYQS